MSARGLRFECTGCGKCCTNRGEYAHVYLSEEETRDLAAFLKLPTRLFKRRHTFVDEYGWRQLVFRDEACVFLDRATSTCTVYPARPAQCRSFPFWSDLIRDGRWTPEARELCEGTGRGRSYSETEVEALVQVMDESGED